MRIKELRDHNSFSPALSRERAGLVIMKEENKSEIAKQEEKILKFWKENDIFKKTLEKPSPKGKFVFYDGPPFATGLPHYGHILAGTMKDVIPRYQTMRGKYVRRVWGWDCHGLPIENLIQKELNVATKKDIEKLGVEKFNEAARSSVFRYDDEWKKIVPRTGRWVDMDNAYTTMDPNFTESVWWGFKRLYEKDLIYEDFKSMHISPLLETPLSNFEVNQNYKDIEDISIYVKFELVDEPGTFLLAWTTTPWTLFGNVALAVGENIEYVKAKKDGEHYIVAKDLAEKVLKEDYKVVKNFNGRVLVGKSYRPVFDHYSKNSALKNHKNGWKIYVGDFVTTEDGTGIVHIAPAFGEDDLNLGKKYNLPFVQHINIDGTIKPEIAELAGRQAKPKSTENEPKKHQETDIEVLKLLAHKGFLFAKEKYTHSYPHCWRTDAPLLNYAMSSWFVKVTAIKNKLISENKKVNWVPSDIKEGRFGNWLEGARDWAISRNRYWGAPIPIWKSEDGKDVEIVGSIEELQKKVPETIIDAYIMRHGESEKNALGIYDDDENTYGLTDAGKKEAHQAACALKGKVDLVCASPIRRTKETAQIVADALGVNLQEAKELVEVDSGLWDGKRPTDIREKALYDNLPHEEMYNARRGETGESWSDVEKRASQFVYKTIKENKGKRILFVTHGGVIVYVLRSMRRLSHSRAYNLFNTPKINSYANPINLKIDLNTLKEFDFHRPYVDEITWKNKEGKVMKRIPDVFDTWVDSGSMPFAQVHYPFEHKKEFDSTSSSLFPADFIAEGLDQTRGWFYVLSVLNNGLFGHVPYKNVIVNGLVLAEDGKKMSKRLSNFPPVEHVLNSYGADAMRYYMLASPVVRAEDLNFSEKGVDEVVKKIILRLKNVYSFFEMYKGDNLTTKRPKSNNILDHWVLARLDELIEEVTNFLDTYELDKAARPLADFVDDLSTWYLRRSRDRFKANQPKADAQEGKNEEDKKQAINTLGYVLREFCKVLAPFMPFLAENIYQGLRGENDVESVHLENWPQQKSWLEKLFSSHNIKVLSDMSEVRKVISSALEERAREGIKVRQPLSKLTTDKVFSDEFNELIKDEVNVKEVVAGDKVQLDLEISPELKVEGVARDIVRSVQDMRKKIGLVPDDSIMLTLDGDKKILDAVKKHQEYISSQVKAVEILFEKVETEGTKTDLGEVRIAVERKSVSFSCDQSKL